jgi:hypothetical protein
MTRHCLERAHLSYAATVLLCVVDGDWSKTERPVATGVPVPGPSTLQRHALGLNCNPQGDHPILAPMRTEACMGREAIGPMAIPARVQAWKLRKSISQGQQGHALLDEENWC